MSSWSDSYYSITFNSRGQKLYGSDPDLDKISIVISSQASIAAKKIALAKSNISVTSDVQVFAYNLLRAVLVTGEANVNVIASKDTFAKVIVEADVDFAVKAIKQTTTSSSITIDTDLLVSAIEILFVESSVSGNTELIVETTKIQFAKSNINIVGYKLTLAKEIVFAKTSIQINSSFNTVVNKDTFAASVLSSNANLSTKAYEINKALINVSSESQVNAKAIKILFALIDVSGFLVKLTISEKFANARFDGKIKTKVLKIPAIKFSPTIIEDRQSIRPLLLIDGKPLTEHNRTLDINIADQFVENTNWASTRSRYYKKKKARKQFSVSWKFVPNSREKTVDQKHGRDIIKEIGENPKVLNMKILNIDSSGTTPYTEISHDIVVLSYQETLVRRDVSDNSYYWDCNLTLEEV